jgi:hypothetical protein
MADRTRIARAIPPSPSRHSIAERRIAVNSIAALLLSGAVAHAHPEYGAVVTNRYLKIDLIAADELRLAYTVMYGAGPALAARKAADGNADGRLDEREAGALGERVRGEVARGLALTVDGAAAAPAFETPVVGLAGAEVAPSPFSVDLVARVRCPGAGPHTVRLDDASRFPDEGETEVRIEEGPATRLVASHRGATGDGIEPRFLFRGPKFSALEDRSITLRFAGAPTAARPVAPPPRPRRMLALIAAGAALALVLVIGERARRRYRNMKG